MGVPVGTPPRRGNPGVLAKIWPLADLGSPFFYYRPTGGLRREAAAPRQSGGSGEGFGPPQRLFLSLSRGDGLQGQVSKGYRHPGLAAGPALTPNPLSRGSGKKGRYPLDSDWKAAAPRQSGGPGGGLGPPPVHSLPLSRRRGRGGWGVRVSPAGPAARCGDRYRSESSPCQPTPRDRGRGVKRPRRTRQLDADAACVRPPLSAAVRRPLTDRARHRPENGPRRSPLSPSET